VREGGGGGERRKEEFRAHGGGEGGGRSRNALKQIPLYVMFGLSPSLPSLLSPPSPVVALFRRYNWQ
jgi:hypothetical protein